MRTLSAIPLALPALARAHDGHGAFGAHLHPGEVLGLVVLAGLVVAALVHLWRR